MKKSNSYSQIAKATGIFGGVQVINIIISIVRSKFVAVLLGPTGVGITGLFNATINMISTITNMGITFSAVRTISEASGTNNSYVIGRTVVSHNRWVSFAGILGSILTICFARQLSNWTFGNNQYTYAFIWLSITLLFQSLCNGQLALLQGLRKLRELAIANVLGSFLGLLFSIPLYYWIGVKAIVPTIIITSIISLLASWYFTKKIALENVTISISESFKDGLDMVKLGIVMMVTGFISTGVMYIIRMYINQKGGIEQVGLYTAAWAILNGYVGMIFTAMGTDYFPRLMSVNNDKFQFNRIVNEQAEIAIIVLGPILLLLLLSLPIFIQLLFSEKFLPVISLIEWALIGVLFKATTWATGFILLAKGEKKIFFFAELFANLLIVSSNLILYHLYGLTGIGLAYLVSYLIYFIFIYCIVKFKYDFHFTMAFVKLLSIQLFLMSVALLVVWKQGFPTSYFSGSIFLLISIIHAYYELKSRIDLTGIIKKVRWS